METQEILRRVVENHNRLAQMLVSADNAILLGDTIRDLRFLAQQLQEDLQRADAAQNEDVEESPEE